MAKAKQGDKVKVHYTGKLQDDSQFDTSRDREPLEFELGEGRVISGFERAVLGMETGETKTVQIPAVEAYGPHRPELIVTVNRTELPDGLQPEIGQQLQVRHSSGRTSVVRVAGATAESVTLDGNHPLAGQDLTFDIELVAII